MRRNILIWLILATLVLVGCSSSPKLGSAPRNLMSEEERQSYIEDLQQGSKAYQHYRDESAYYNEEGIVVTSDYILEVETWKLHELSNSYEEQNSLDYVLEADELDKLDYDWMTSAVTTKDFNCIVRLYGDYDTMTLDIQLTDNIGKYIIAPQSCMINGVLKNKTLFRATENEEGHFLITANMKDFAELSAFGLSMENISSLAWYLTAINTETKETNNFLLATAFPDDYTWDGLKVSETFSASSGIIMWIMRSDSYTYLCTFNGNNKKIESDIIVTSTAGDMISDSFRLDVSSGEFTYIQLGFNLEGVTVKTGDTLLLSE